MGVGTIVGPPRLSLLHSESFFPSYGDACANGLIYRHPGYIHFCLSPEASLVPFAEQTFSLCKGVLPFFCDLEAGLGEQLP